MFHIFSLVCFFFNGFNMFFRFLSAPLKPRSGQIQVLETHVLAQSLAQENAMNFRLLCRNLGLAKPVFAGR